MSFLEDLLAEIDREVETTVELRHRLHENPELSHQETRTGAAIAEALPVESVIVAKTGRLARISGGSGPRIAVRAELDGLPVDERTGAEYASTNGAMHACGHDVHMAAVVALARAAERLRTRLPAELIAIFQPSEEADPSGARMLAEGELPGLGLDAAVGAHVHPALEWGSIALDPGAINASADTVEVTVRGASTHGAYPHQGRDPILALSAIVVACHAQVGRTIDPLNPAVITFGTLEAGTQENVIPELARAKATLRAFEPADREALIELVDRVAVSVAAAHGCEASVEVRRGEPALDNDPGMVEASAELLDTAGLTRGRPWRSCGADDFSFFGSACPIAMAFVGIDGYPGFESRPLHHPELLIPDEAVRQVARTLGAMFCGAVSNLERG
ncbi:MAG: amidohydrolase [Solirubrobacterales bacterium]|nr:amidohydrolase [Solirubrobacterales bacterium]